MANTLSIVTDFAFSREDQHLLRETAGPDCRLEFAQDIATMRVALPNADILCSFRPPRDFTTLAPKLQWLQYPGAGIDGLFKEGLLRQGMQLQVTTANTVNVQAIAEYAFGAMLIFARKWDEMLRMQQRKKWATGTAWGELRGFELQGKTLGIIGFGTIGHRVAQIARGFQMRVLGLRRKVDATPDPDCDQLYRPDQLLEMLGESDIVLVSVPLTGKTRNLIGERELAAMRPNAYLINVARGEVIHEPALIRALTERWIAGAGLDVVVEEPLSADSPLWSLPGVLLTPHLSGLTTGYAHRMAELFADNIQRFQRHTELRYLVDFNDHA